MHALAAETKVMTDLTCWKCGEESLKEFVLVEDKHLAKSANLAPSTIRHSDCQKCGAYSTNPAQMLHNRIVARANRKAIIKESNRKSG